MVHRLRGINMTELNRSCAGTGFTVARFTRQMTGDIYAHTRSGVHAIERGNNERERLSVAEHSHS